MTRRQRVRIEQRVDRCGEIKAEIAELNEELAKERKAIEEKMRADGLSEVEGDVFRVSLGEDTVSERLDTDACKEYLERNLSPARFAKFFKEVPVKGRFLVSARQGEE